MSHSKKPDPDMEVVDMLLGLRRRRPFRIPPPIKDPASEDYPPAKPKPPSLPDYHFDPSTGYSYPITAPEANENYVFVGNSNNFKTDWRQIGTPITQEDVGEKTFNTIGRDVKYKPEHHNTSIPGISRLSDDALREGLAPYDIPEAPIHDMERKELFNLYVNSHSPKISPDTRTGERPPTDAERNFVHAKFYEQNSAGFVRAPQRAMRNPIPQPHIAPNAYGSGSNPATINNSPPPPPIDPPAGLSDYTPKPFQNLSMSDVADAGKFAVSATEMAVPALARGVSAAQPYIGTALMAKSLYDSYTNKEDSEDRQSSEM